MRHAFRDAEVKNILLVEEKANFQA